MINMMVLFSAVGGLTYPLDGAPDWLKWFQWFSPWRYGSEGLLDCVLGHKEYACDTFFDRVQECSVGGPSATVQGYSLISQVFFEGGDLSPWETGGALLCLSLVFRLLACLVFGHTKFWRVADLAG